MTLKFTGGLTENEDEKILATEDTESTEIKNMKRIAILLLLFAVCSTSFGQGTPVLPYMSTWIRTLFDDETQAAAQTTLGLGTGNSPTWAGATFTGNSVLGLNSAVFQPLANSATFFQVLNVLGNPILNIDTVNKRISVGLITPLGVLHLYDGSSGTTPSATANNIVLESGGSSGISFLSGNTSQANIFFGDTDDNDRGMIQYLHTGDLLKFRVGAVYIAVFKNTGIGIGSNVIAPETIVEVEYDTPYITLHNNTHEDTDGGRESRLNFKGEQSGGEETTLVRIEVSHDEAADDQKGKIVISTNDGADGDTPTDAVIIGSNQALSTPNRAATLGVGATTFVITGNLMTVTGDGGGNTIGTITGANSGTLLTIIFVDALVTITDTDAHTANTVDLSAAFTSADDTVLQIVFDGTSWYETSRSIN